MYKKTISLLLATTSLAISGSFVPEERSIIDIDAKYYIGMSLGLTDLKNDASIEKFSSKNYSLVAGVKLGEYFGVETRYFKGFGKLKYEKGITQNTDTSDYSAELSAYGIYVKPRYEIYDFTIFALLGYGQTQIDSIPKIETAKRTEKGFQWGVGSSYSINDEIDIFVDYVSFYNDTGFDGRAKTSTVKSSSLNIGMNYKF